MYVIKNLDSGEIMEMDDHVMKDRPASWYRFMVSDGRWFIRQYPEKCQLSFCRFSVEHDGELVANVHVGADFTAWYAWDRSGDLHSCYYHR